ncbi:hypothetical protein [Mycetocola reblochoni]|uniref:Uncharacterized protein n=2 Tax=Mycetocola reblochoni TaxID=331618 RepID=A0A1R4JQI5_9MICO|nr:hypothetical protein [Mycetocola reblochoni]RLP69312.1 hypothetical protein D9V30_08375 [Mycetocola reblochoni]SJN34257.1 hypothetical protein FM119_08875 [Mycetocola reblochoni REB411]
MLQAPRPPWWNDYDHGTTAEDDSLKLDAFAAALAESVARYTDLVWVGTEVTTCDPATVVALYRADAASPLFSQAWTQAELQKNFPGFSSQDRADHVLQNEILPVPARGRSTPQAPLRFTAETVEWV